MTSCLDITACPNDKRMYNVPCRFSAGMNVYVCNVNTCANVDGRHDCCAYNISDCLVLESSLYLPTVQPTVAINENACNPQLCQTKYSADKCYWYESMQTDNLCKENNNEYCCSQNRADCCITNKTGAYIVFGSIAGIIILTMSAYYWHYYVKKSHKKIEPAKEATEVEPQDRYKMINNL